MMNNGYQQYQRIQVQTAGPGELLLLLYNGAIKFLNRAKVAIESKQIEVAHNSLIRSQEIILELRRALDVNACPAAVNLDRIYDYVYRRLVQANIKKETEPIDEVLGLLRELLSAWEQVIGNNQQLLVRQAQPPAPPPVAAVGNGLNTYSSWSRTQ